MTDNTDLAGDSTISLHAPPYVPLSYDNSLMCQHSEPPTMAPNLQVRNWMDEI
jgi:hypothetical protein